MINMTEQEFMKMYEDKEADLKYKKRRVAASINSLHALQGLLDKQAAELRKEKADVDGLEKLSIKNLFNKITNKTDEAARKEEQEYFDAKIRYEELQNSLRLTEKEIGDMQADISFLEKELYSLKESGRKQFAAIDKKFQAAENEIVRLKSEIKELDEAIESGNRVCAAIQKAVRKLEKARGWATYDMFTKGGIISHMAKYGNIDEAQEIIKEIGHLIDVFQRELKDVNISFYGGADNYDGTTRFIDFFFDNIFTDFSVRGRIEDDINRLSHLNQEIESTINKLLRTKENALQRISGLA